MTKLQYSLLIGATALFFVLYFGCETKAPQQQKLEKSRALSAESTDIESLIRDAQATLSADVKGVIALLDEELASLPEEDTARIGLLKQLSGRWYGAGHPSIAGYYAEGVAELQNTEEAWSIAGTTYAIGVQRSENPDIRDFCSQRAVSAFEKAISFSPENVSHQVNLALTYVDNPPADDQMKGILMLRSLQEKYPQNVLVLNTLAGLALRTKQYDRAVQRLEQALSLEPDNQNTICMLSEAYLGIGDQAKAQIYEQKCRQMQGINQ